MEKVELILQLLHPYTFIPSFTVIRDMRVHINENTLVCVVYTAECVLVHAQTN